MTNDVAWTESLLGTSLADEICMALDKLWILRFVMYKWATVKILGTVVPVSSESLLPFWEGVS
jgi:hypothetical protein